MKKGKRSVEGNIIYGNYENMYFFSLLLNKKLMDFSSPFPIHLYLHLVSPSFST